ATRDASRSCDRAAWRIGDHFQAMEPAGDELHLPGAQAGRWSSRSGAPRPRHATFGTAKCCCTTRVTAPRSRGCVVQNWVPPNDAPVRSNTDGPWALENGKKMRGFPISHCPWAMAHGPWPISHPYLGYHPGVPMTSWFRRRWGTCHLSQACVLGLAVAICGVVLAAQSPGLPHLRKQGGAPQLVVDGRPFLVRGGELGNSSASNLEYLAPYWSRFGALRLNTILTPIYWDLLERDEGKLDFALVDGLISEARKHGLKLILLWFGSWKNSMSCLAPAWVNTDPRRFPRSVDATGRSLEILSPFSSVNRDADARAFAALMTHLKAIDEAHTVV